MHGLWQHCFRAFKDFIAGSMDIFLKGKKIGRGFVPGPTLPNALVGNLAEGIYADRRKANTFGDTRGTMVTDRIKTSHGLRPELVAFLRASGCARACSRLGRRRSTIEVRKLVPGAGQRKDLPNVLILSVTVSEDFSGRYKVLHSPYVARQKKKKNSGGFRVSGSL